MLIPITLIIPTYNEEKNKPKILHNIKLLNPKEIIIVDGNSLSKPKIFDERLKIISTISSRGIQLHTATKYSRQSWLLFLHADTKLCALNIKEIIDFIKKSPSNKIAYFKIKFDSSNFIARIIALWGNLRTKLFHLPFGDQCLIISQNYYKSLGGFAPIPIMEDMELMLKIPKNNKTLLNTYIQTSFRKYEKNGVFKQSFKNILRQIKFLLK